MKVGILAIQGDVGAHAKAVERLGAEASCVRREKDLAGIVSLILPRGASTTIANDPRALVPIRAKLCSPMNAAEFTTKAVARFPSGSRMKAMSSGRLRPR